MSSDMEGDIVKVYTDIIKIPDPINSTGRKSNWGFYQTILGRRVQLEFLPVEFEILTRLVVLSWHTQARGVTGAGLDIRGGL